MFRIFVIIIIWLFLNFSITIDRAQATKPTVPLDIEVIVSDTSQLSKGTIYITANISMPRITPKVSIKTVKMNARSISGGSLVEPAEIDISGLEPKKPIAIKLKVVPAFGQSEIAIGAVAFGSDGKLLFGRGVHLYLIWDGKELLSGIGSFTELIIKKLKRDLSEGYITKEQYERQMNKLLGGGAKETNE